jgi:electron transfer flavoprotein beta subunit
MKILVCISNVPDTTTKIRFADEDTRLDSAGVQWIINPWDELSLTRALELKDDPAAGVTSVTVIHVGGADSEPTIRKALAIGADNAVRVNTTASDSLLVAAQIADVIKNDQYDLVFCGIESSDFNGSMVGGMIAEYLDWPSITGVSDVRAEEGKLLMTREVYGGKEVVAVQTPLVAIVQKGIAKEPRIASMRGIMTARTKPVNVVEPVEADSLTVIESYELPPPRAACRFIDPENPAELVELLQNEAKVI